MIVVNATDRRTSTELQLSRNSKMAFMNDRTIARIIIAPTTIPPKAPAKTAPKMPTTLEAASTVFFATLVSVWDGAGTCHSARDDQRIRRRGALVSARWQ